MQAGDIVAAIDLGTSRTAYAYTVVGREHIWLGVPDSPDDDRNVSLVCVMFLPKRGRRGKFVCAVSLFVNKSAGSCVLPRFDSVCDFILCLVPCHAGARSPVRPYALELQQPLLLYNVVSLSLSPSLRPYDARPPRPFLEKFLGRHSAFSPSLVPSSL